MNKLLTVIVLLVLQLQSSAQNPVHFRGFVHDAETGEPIAFASIGVLHQPLGTVSNLEGAFKLNVPSTLASDSITISSIGYDLKVIALQDIHSDSMITIQLSTSETLLDVVTVVDSLSGNEIMKLALEKMGDNHPNFPISMNAFYREKQIVDGDYVSLVEAAITTYDKNNFKKRKSPVRSKIRVDELRRSLSYEHPYADWWNKENLLLRGWNLNPIPYDLSELYKMLTLGNYARVGKTAVHGHDTYIVTSKNAEYWNTKYFIQAQTYAFVRIEEYYALPEDKPKGWTLYNDSTDIDVIVQERKVVVDFKAFDDKYFPSFIKFDSYQDYLIEEEKIFNFRIIQDIIINNIIVDSPVKIERNEALRIPKSLKSEEYKYNKTFWENFNIIQETPLEAKLISDLEKKISLETQFNTND